MGSTNEGCVVDSERGALVDDGRGDSGSGTGPTPTTHDVSIRRDDGAVMVVELADAQGRFLL